MTANYCRLDGTFLLRKNLLSATPAVARKNFIVYSGSAVANIDLAKLIYFAAGVFWRPSVLDWRLRPTGRFIRADLGPFGPALSEPILLEDGIAP